MDKVIFLILKKSISYNEIEKGIFPLFDKICLDEPNVHVFSNFKKSYEWELNNNHIRHFYNFLENTDSDNFVFMRIGENVEDIEILGDCYCNFKKYLNNYDFQIIRDIKIVKKASLKKIERKKQALRYFLEFLENINFENDGEFDKLSLIYITEENSKKQNIKKNIIEFDYNDKHYVISKNILKKGESKDYD